MLGDSDQETSVAGPGSVLPQPRLLEILVPGESGGIVSQLNTYVSS